MARRRHGTDTQRRKRGTALNEKPCANAIVRMRNGMKWQQRKIAKAHGYKGTRFRGDEFMKTWRRVGLEAQ